MDIAKKTDRTLLKSYFSKNAVPTAGNFADLVDGMINQKEDGIAKVAGEPLSVQAEGDSGQQKAINFYRSFADPKAAWSLSLNPRATPADPASARPGLSIGDADGNSRLFIEQSTGNLGVGTVAPGGYKLNVNGPALFTGNYLYANAENAGRLRVGAAWGMPGLYSSDDGARPLTLGVPAGQRVYIGVSNGDAFIEGGTGNCYFKGNVGIGTATPENKLQLAGNLHMVGNSIFLRGDDPKDQYDVIKWNRGTDRVDMGGYNGVSLGYTQGTPGNVTPVITVGRDGIVQQAWQGVAFQNAWRNYANGYNDAGYFKDSMGIVHLRGLVAGGGINTIFVLPAGYRPAFRQLFVCCTNPNVAGRVDVTSAGEVTVVVGNSGWVSLDGLTFRAEA